MELTDIPSEVIIYVILPYLQYKYKKKNDLNIKTLFGYFKLDCMSACSEKLKVPGPSASSNREIWLIWRGLWYEYRITKLITYPLLTSLRLNDCFVINELKEYSYLTSLTLKKNNISELKEYPHLTSLAINRCRMISELKEYPLLTYLTLKECKISELKEYPLLIFLSISGCEHLEDIDTRNKKDIQKYIQKYTPK